MNITNFNFTFENIRTITTMFLDIFIMWLVLYYAIKIVRANSRTIQIFKGILLVIIVDAIAKFLGLKTLQYLTAIFINWGFLAVIIIFQPEIRSLLERLGKSNVFSRITTLTGNEKENLVDQIVTATVLLSQDQTGALISIEQSYSLDDYIATGTKMNSDVTAELLTSIFVTSTPLHDGAVIIQGDKIACASAYFPPTNLDLPSRYGARHRAAIGISEITDAVTIVVSEETGAISIADGGKIFHVNKRQLRNYLLRVICGEETEVLSSHDEALDPARQVIIEDEPKEVPEATGVMSKIAIKKQEGNLPEEKIEVEEVVSQEQVYKKEEVEEPVEEKEKEKEVIIIDEPVHKEKKKKKGLFHFGSKEEDEPVVDAMDKIDDGAKDIKLPKKKDRKKPSYPEHKVAEVAPVVEEKLPDEPLVEEEVVEEPAKQRMSAEDVARLREENKKKLASNTESMVVVREPYKEEVKEEPEQVFDTTKLDISKIVGLDKELDEALSIVDKLEPESSKQGGEDHE